MQVRLLPGAPSPVAETDALRRPVSDLRRDAPALTPARRPSSCRAAGIVRGQSGIVAAPESPAKKRLQAANNTGLSAHDLCLWRGERQVLHGLSVTAAAGDCVHVAGPNGSGKTTLLRVLAGLLTAEQGSVSWQGRPISADREAYGASLSYLGHMDGLKAEFTARENLAFEAGLRRRLAAGEIDQVLARVALTGSRDQPVRSLSAGQRRRLAMARVMLTGAPLWLLDEPFTNLDDAGVQCLSEEIAGHLDAGGAALIASHQSPKIPRHALRRLDLG
ncbi:MAG: cytochrome c biogenesis heme-transporting ATPase CcmA [Steroidobacteraceae bacterium]